MISHQYVSKAIQDDARKPNEWWRTLHIALAGTVAIIAMILLGNLGAALMMR
jgi:hypothetical protein